MRRRVVVAAADATALPLHALAQSAGRVYRVGILRDRAQIIALAAKHRLPAMYEWGDQVVDGGLMAYSTSLHGLRQRLASYVDRILKGARPADMPVEQPTKFERVINLKTARALGLTIPQSLLLRADEVIQ